MVIASLVISIVAIVFSAIATIITLIITKKINDINLDFELIKEPLSKFLIDDLPAAMNDICFDNNKLCHIGLFQEMLPKLKRQFKFLQFVDEPTYNEIVQASDNIEDFVVNNEGNFFSETRQKEFRDDLTKKIALLYEKINAFYKNGKRKS